MSSGERLPDRVTPRRFDVTLDCSREETEGVALTRFYFNVRTPRDFMADLEGADLPDLASAEFEAIRDARAAMATAIVRGFDISQDSIVEICDANGSVLSRVPFRDMIRHRS